MNKSFLRPASVGERENMAQQTKVLRFDSIYITSNTNYMLEDLNQ